jgi:hypothetical protein
MMRTRKFVPPTPLATRNPTSGLKLSPKLASGERAIWVANA